MVNMPSCKSEDYNVYFDYVEYEKVTSMHSNPKVAVTLSVRGPPQTRNELEELALATGRTKSFLAAEAIRHYLEINAWQIKATEEAVKKSDSKAAAFAKHDDVVDWLSTWGDKNEKEPPECE